MPDSNNHPLSYMIAAAALAPYGVRNVLESEIFAGLEAEAKVLLDNLSEKAIDEILEGREETPYLKEEDQGRIYAKEHLDLFGSNYQDASGQTRRMMFVWHVLIDEAYAHAREIKGDIPDC